MDSIRFIEKFILFLLIFTVCSCVKEVTLDFPEYQNHLVVNSLLVPDSIIKVQLTESVKSDEPEIFTNYKKAEVQISNSIFSIKLDNLGNGIYTAQVHPIQGTDYFLKVKTPDGKVLTSFTRIPDQPVITITPLSTENLVQVNITDNPMEENYYWIGKKSYSISNDMMYHETYVSSDFILFDDFNRTRGDVMMGELSYSYHFYARLPDYKFNGKQVSFTLPHYWNEPEDYDFLSYREYLYIINADENLDKYMKSALIQYELGVIGDMPVFHTPIDMYSNIENGKGIFGSYTLTQFDITTP